MRKYLLMIMTSAFLFSGCTTLLNRNQTRGGFFPKEKQHTSSLLGTLFGDDEEDLQNDFKEGRRPTAKPRIANNQPIIMSQAPQLSLIEGNTWRTSAHPGLVYGIMARTLSQNYIISSSDRKNLNLQTDWDKFFIDGRLFRNRINVLVFPVNARQTEVVIKNVVEYYTGNPNVKEENSAWLPSPDITDEIQKLVANTNRQTTIAYSSSLRQR